MLFETSHQRRDREARERRAARRAAANRLQDAAIIMLGVGLLLAIAVWIVGRFPLR